MPSNFKKFVKFPNTQRFVAALVIFSFFFTSIFPPLAEAQFVVTDPVHTAVTAAESGRKTIKDALDTGAMIAAQLLVDEIVRSTINWANTGFEGGPAYVTDTGQYFTNLADGIAGEFIAGTDLNFMCSPFQRSVRISLVNSYYQPPETRFQCTLSDISGNIEDFFDGSFNRGGGWDAWFSMTQNPTNNPYGAYIEAKIELDSRVAAAVGLKQEQLNWNQGFRSLTECLAFNPSDEVIRDYEMGTYGPGTPGQAIADGTIPYDPTKPAGACIKDGPVKTAGTTIKAQLDNVLPSGLEKLISVDHIEQLVGALAAGLLQRYVFGDQGLFSSNYNDHLNESNDSTPTTSCLATPNRSGIGQEVVWSAQSNLRSATYSWSGDEISPQEGTSISITYQNPGTKRARVSVLGINSSGRPVSTSASCSNSVNVGTTADPRTETPPPTEDPDNTGTQPENTETF